MTHQLLAWLSGDNTLLSGFGLQWASGLLALIGILLNDKARKPSAFAPVAPRRQQLERDQLFDHALDMMCVAGFDGYLKQVNQAFTQTLGWSREELLSKPYLEWVHPDDRETSIAANERLLQGESLISFEMRWLCQDGSFRWLQWSAFASTSDQTLFGVARDVTERKQSEEQSHLAATVFQNSAEAIVVTDAKTRILSVNPAFTQVTGYRLEEVIGRTPRLLKSGRHEETFYREMWRNLKEQDFWQGDIWNRKKSGDIYQEWLTISAVRDSRGAVINYVASFSDVTECHRIQQELLAAKEAAEAATLAKSEFLANMSHEIRTPLNAIIGMAQVMAETPLNEEQAHYVEIFRRSSDTLLLLVNDILDVSKIEAGQVKLDNTTFDVEDLLEKLLSLSCSQAKDKGLTLDWSFEPGLARLRYGDSYRLQQILSNLLSNALKFTDSGEVRVSVTAAKGAEGLCFTVADTGIGIPADKLDSIFEKFIQADSTTTRQYGGTGLGLTICSKLVELMGGCIWVESEVGKGSAFHVVLPLPSKSAAEAQAASDFDPSKPHKEAPGESLRILLVEDAEDNREVLSAFLKSTAHRLEFAVNGAIAVERVKTERFDVILMDMQMPVMDGFAATRAIRSWQRGRGETPTPIIALTAYALKAEVEKCLAAGCDKHLSKPVSKETLLAALQAFAPSGEPVEKASESPVPLEHGNVVVVRKELQSLIPNFLIHRREDVEKLRTTLGDDQMETIRAIGHAMAGTGGSYGFKAITEMGRALEAAAKAADRLEIEQIITQLEGYLEHLDIRYE